MQKEYITILGIFAAVVLAFTGGLSFSGSVFEGIGKASVYRVFAVVFILGLILLNTFWLLIDFIRSINEKPIRKWWIILFADGLMIAGLILTFFAYKYHWLDSGDSDNKQQTQSERTISTEGEITYTEDNIIVPSPDIGDQTITSGQ